ENHFGQCILSRDLRIGAVKSGKVDAGNELQVVEQGIGDGRTVHFFYGSKAGELKTSPPQIDRSPSQKAGFVYGGVWLNGIGVFLHIGCIGSFPERVPRPEVEPLADL